VFWGVLSYMLVPEVDYSESSLRFPWFLKMNFATVAKNRPPPLRSYPYSYILTSYDPIPIPFEFPLSSSVERAISAA
jgi:hypothetical protein